MVNKIIAYFKKANTSEKVFVFAFLFLCFNAAIDLFHHIILKQHFPYNSFIFNAGFRFSDFLLVIDSFGISRTWFGHLRGQMGVNIMPPFNIVVYYFFAYVIYYVGHMHLVYASLIAVIIGGVSIISRKIGNSYLLILLTILTYPLIFAVDRGNLATIVFLFLVIALYSDKIVWSTFALAIATSIKLTPLIFILPIILKGPFTFQRAIKIIGLELLWLIVINGVSVWLINHVFFPPNYNPALFFSSLPLYNEIMVVHRLGLAFGSSLYMAVIIILAHFSKSSTLVSTIMPYVTAGGLAILFFVLVGLFLLWKGKVKTITYEVFDYRKLTYILCYSFVLFMPVTADYYLLVLLIPLILYPEMIYSWGYLVVYALVIAPKNLILLTEIQGHPIWLQVFINPILLLLLLLAEFDLIPFMKRASPISGVEMGQSKANYLLSLITRRA